MISMPRTYPHSPSTLKFEIGIDLYDTRNKIMKAINAHSFVRMVHEGKRVLHFPAKDPGSCLRKAMGFALYD